MTGFIRGSGKGLSGLRDHEPLRKPILFGEALTWQIINILLLSIWSIVLQQNVTFYTIPGHHGLGPPKGFINDMFYKDF